MHSSTSPDGFGRNRPLEIEPTDDSVGDAIFTPAPVAEVEDRWSRLADALVGVESHPLVKHYGFPPDLLIVEVDSDHPVAMGFEVLTMTLAACQAADELADLAGEREVCRVLRWTGDVPQSLKAFGANRLFKGAAALQARIGEIQAERARPEPAAKAKTTPSQSSTALPMLILNTAPRQAHRGARPLPDIPSKKPESSDWLGRISSDQGLAYRCTCGCGASVLEEVAKVPPFKVMRDRMGSRVEAKDLWAHAFAPRCIRTWGHGFSLVETRTRAFKAQEEATARHSRTQRPVRPSRPKSGEVSGGIGAVGKTARKRAAKAERAAKEGKK